MSTSARARPAARACESSAPRSLPPAQTRCGGDSAKMLVLAEEQDRAGLDVVGLMLSASRPLGQRFLEPVVGERLVVERSDLGPAGGAVQGERLGEDCAGLDVRDLRAAGQRARLKLLQ
jgi:hypothetical protein